MARDRSFRDQLDEDLDRAAAGQADIPGHLVSDAVADQLRLSGAQHLLRLFEDGGLDTAAADRPGEVPGGGNGHGRPNRTRCGAFDFDDGGDRHLVAGGTPGIDIRQNVFHRSISFLDWPRSPHAARTWGVSSINGSGCCPARTADDQAAAGGKTKRRTGGSSSTWPRRSASASRLCKLWMGRNSSM